MGSGSACAPNFGCVRGTKPSFFTFARENSGLQPLMMAISADRNYNMAWHDIWPQEEGRVNATTFARGNIPSVTVNQPVKYMTKAQLSKSLVETEVRTVMLFFNI